MKFLFAKLRLLAGFGLLTSFVIFNFPAGADEQRLLKKALIGSINFPAGADEPAGDLEVVEEILKTSVEKEQAQVDAKEPAGALEVVEEIFKKNFDKGKTNKPLCKIKTSKSVNLENKDIIVTSETTTYSRACFSKDEDWTLSKADLSPCENQEQNHVCKEQCRDIYSQRDDRNDCEELTVAQIEHLDSLHSALKNPNYHNLYDIDSYDFDFYLNISMDPLEKHIKRYSQRKAVRFLLWMIDNPDIARIFQDKEDYDYDILDKLLKRIKSFSGNNHHLPFITPIFRPALDIKAVFGPVVNIEIETLMEMAIKSGDEDLMDWLQGYINEENSDCDADDTSLACFSVYCKIGSGMSEDSAMDWLSYWGFEDYINDIIEKGTNHSMVYHHIRRSSDDNSSPPPDRIFWGKGHDKKEYQDVGDLTGSWVDALCKAGQQDLTINNLKIEGIFQKELY